MLVTALEPVGGWVLLRLDFQLSQWRRFLAAHSEQRVCPSMGLFVQVTQRPSSSWRCRLAAECARPRSRFCSSVRLVLVSLAGFGSRWTLARDGLVIWAAWWGWRLALALVGFAAVVAGFEPLRAGARAAAGLAGSFFLRLGSGGWS